MFILFLFRTLLCTSLRFATQAKNVKNKPQRNEVVSDASLLIRYAKQLIKLQKELQVYIIYCSVTLIVITILYNNYHIIYIQIVSLENKKWKLIYRR